MNQQALHREECLEAEIRRLRQALKIVCDAIIAGELETALEKAKLARDLLENNR